MAFAVWTISSVKSCLHHPQQKLSTARLELGCHFLLPQSCLPSKLPAGSRSWLILAVSQERVPRCQGWSVVVPSQHHVPTVLLALGECTLLEVTAL